MKNMINLSGWKKKVFVFLASQCITLLGSSIVQMAIIWYVTLQTSSGIWVTAITLCSFIPQMVISFFSGVWADRYSRKKLIIVADTVIAVATLAFAIFLMFDKIAVGTLPAIIVISIIRSLGAGVQTPAVNAMIPQLVPVEQILRYNGINASIMSVVQFAAPAVAGAIMAFGKLEYILLIDVLTAIVGVVMLMVIKIPKHTISASEKTPSLFVEMRAGIRYCFINKFVGKILLTYGAFIFLCVPSGFLITLLIERTFGKNVWYLSINEMVGCLGMVLGGLVLGAWGGSKNRNKTYIIGMIAYATFSITLGFASHFILFVALMFCVSFFIPVVQSASMAMLQEKTEPDMQGRVFSLLNVMFSGFMPLGMAVFGPLSDYVSIRWLIVGTGIVIALMAILIRCSRAFYIQGITATAPTQEKQSQSSSQNEK